MVMNHVFISQLNEKIYAWVIRVVVVEKSLIRHAHYMGEFKFQSMSKQKQELKIIDTSLFHWLNWHHNVSYRVPKNRSCIP